MLSRCPECELPVSDKALSCPHCGYPLKSERHQTRHLPKRMRLPNGFGQISELKGRNLRRPFRAMITVGKDENGRPICKTLKPQGYFSSYNEAYAALVEYHKQPYDQLSETTMTELYDAWSTKHYPQLTGNTLVLSYKAAWRRCEQISQMRVVDVKPSHIKSCIATAPTPNTKKLVKMLLNLMFDYAIEIDAIDRNVARSFELEKNIRKQAIEQRVEHVPFTKSEMRLLWMSVDSVAYVDIILIQCYMGWRPGELGLLLLDNVDLDNRTIVGGVKTAAGRMRTVPIHDAVYPFVLRRYKEALANHKPHLFNCLDSGNGELTYNKYRVRFARAMDQLGIEGHRAHDPRKTFVTMCKESGVDEYAIKHMIGHAITDITESVYTTRSTEWLAAELCKVPDKNITDGVRDGLSV